MTNLQVDGLACGTCDEPFEDGDRAYAVWSGDVEGDDFVGTGLSFYHSGCLDTTDPRPRNRVVESSTGTKHLVRHSGSVVCRNSAVTIPDDAEPEVVHDPIGMIGGMCKVCLSIERKWRRP